MSGRFELDGAERAFECLGLRTSRSGGFDLAKLESVRAVSTWFEPDEGLALVAFRGRKAKSHEGEWSPPRCSARSRPRRSRTRACRPRTTPADGRSGPASSCGSAGDGEEEQFPRRASGEAAGARAQAAAGDLELRAEPFRWHSRGREGAGIYILARRR